MSDNIVPITSASRRKRAAPPSGPTITDLAPSWRLDVEQRNLSPETVRLYMITLRDCSAWLTEHGMPTDVETIDVEHIRAFLAAWKERSSPGRADQHRRNLSVFFNWLAKEGERTAPNPMTRIGKIKASKVARPLFTDDELAKLIKACAGNDFEARRDTAIIRTFIDNGMRVSGMAGLRYHPDDQDRTDVFLSRHFLRIRLKGGDQFLAPIGKKTAAAIDRYIRARARHPQAESPWLWLPARSRTTVTGDYRLTASGIYQMIERRGEQAHVEGAHPHKFRRTSTHQFLKAGGDIIEAMRVMGWKSITMVRMYAEELEDERAREAHARLSPGDRI